MFPAHMYLSSIKLSLITSMTAKTSHTYTHTHTHTYIYKYYQYILDTVGHLLGAAKHTHDICISWYFSSDWSIPACSAPASWLQASGFRNELIAYVLTWKRC